jgi:IclR family pca regulon transcriptional regulator
MPAGDAFVQSLDRGLAVIRSFDADAPRQTLSEVATATGLTRATARRFLLTLVDLGYIRSDGKEFALSPKTLDLGYAYLSGLSLPELARPHLDSLSRSVGESTSVSILDGDDIVYVARVAARRITSVRIMIGTRFPAHATSMGRVLLAAMPPAELDSYLERLHASRFTAATVVDHDELRKAVARAREQGWALVDQELEIGLRSVAAPILKDGRVIAAINVATTSSTTSLDAIRDRIVPELVLAARLISADVVHVDISAS